MRKLCLPVGIALVSLSLPARADEAPAPPPPAPAPAPSSGVELSTLRLLHEKNVLSDKEYESALSDLANTSGAAAKDSTSVVVGKWATTLYGFVEADSIFDSTQSFNDLAGNAQVARPDTYAGSHDRMQFGVRNSRIGFRMKAPEVGGIRSSAVAEMDFLGTQLPIGYGQPYYGSEAAYFTNPTFRVRHMYLKAENGVVDVLLGQTWDLFGWQSMYQPNTVEIQGVPGELYSRTPQLRLSKTIKSEAVTFEIAAAAVRPPQRNSAVPEGQGGVRLAVNGWTGVQTVGATATQVQPLSIALTGDLRHVDVPVMTSKPTSDVSKSASAGAIDVFIPAFRASKEDNGNALSFNGEFVSGYGIADLYTGLNGGVSFPALPNPTGANPAPVYPQDIDNGIATVGPDGQLHFVQWTTYLIGAQYYLPGTHGHLWISGNFSRQESSNTSTLYPAPPAGTTSTTPPATTKIRHAETWFDANVFADVTPAIRVGAEYAHFDDEYLDGTHGQNHRVQVSGFFLF